MRISRPVIKNNDAYSLRTDKVWMGIYYHRLLVNPTGKLLSFYYTTRDVTQQGMREGKMRKHFLLNWRLIAVDSVMGLSLFDSYDIRVFSDA